jgi:hypothetical protein
MKKMSLLIVFGIFLFVVFWLCAPLLTAKARAQYFLKVLPPEMCSLELTPGEVPGNIWEKHRYYLEAPTIYRGSRLYVIQDTRTQAIYYWSRLDDHNGHTRFSVLSRFALFYRDWESSRWVLLYKC